jgi:hypothetical protein
VVVDDHDTHSQTLLEPEPRPSRADLGHDLRDRTPRRDAADIVARKGRTGSAPAVHPARMMLLLGLVAILAA